MQTLPANLLEATLTTLRWMVEHAGMTLVLCTATLPALVRSEWLPCGFEKVEPIVEPGPLFTALKRVDYKYDPEPISIEDLAARMAAPENPRVLRRRNSVTFS